MVTRLLTCTLVKDLIYLSKERKKMLFEVITRGCIDNNKEFDNKGHILFHFKGLKR